MLSVALTGSRCWLTAWICLIINRDACATTDGLWWQKLRPLCLPLPFRLPKCHLNEIGPRSWGIRHCIITYLKTLIEHFIKRVALRFCQGGHYSERQRETERERQREVLVHTCIYMCCVSMCIMGGGVMCRYSKWWLGYDAVHAVCLCFQKFSDLESKGYLAGTFSWLNTGTASQTNYIPVLFLN